MERGGTFFLININDLFSFSPNGTYIWSLKAWLVGAKNTAIGLNAGAYATIMMSA
jgi:hypothetical protein